MPGFFCEKRFWSCKVSEKTALYLQKLPQKINLKKYLIPNRSLEVHKTVVKFVKP